MGPGASGLHHQHECVTWIDLCGRDKQAKMYTAHLIHQHNGVTHRTTVEAVVYDALFIPCSQ
jgi:hypothetical protein